MLGWLAALMLTPQALALGLPAADEIAFTPSGSAMPVRATHAGLLSSGEGARAAVLYQTPLGRCVRTVTLVKGEEGEFEGRIGDYVLKARPAGSGGPSGAWHLSVYEPMRMNGTEQLLAVAGEHAVPGPVRKNWAQPQCLWLHRFAGR